MVSMKNYQMICSLNHYQEDANNLAEKQSIENWNIDLKIDLVETKKI